MSDFKSIPGGICAPKGFSAAGVHCGIRHNHSKLDLALIKADVRCAGAGCYTTNKVYGAPITVDREHLKDGYAQAIVVNSGNANTCAPNGVQLAKDTCDIVAKELGIRFHPVRSYHSVTSDIVPPEVVDSIEGVMGDAERLVKKYHDPSRFSMCQVGIGPSIAYYETEEIVRATIDLAEKLDIKVHGHLAESRGEVAFVEEHYGCRPAEWFRRHDLLGDRFYYAHCIHLNDEEVQLMADTNTGISTCPISNMYLSSGSCRIPDLLRAGVKRFGIGVDGAASSNSASMMEEIRVSYLLNRLSWGDDSIGCEDILYLATAGGAAALGRDDIGHLAPGMAADFTLMNWNQLQYAGGCNDPVDCIVLSGDARMIETVVVNGETVVKNGRLTKVNEEEKRDYAAAVGRELLTKASARIPGLKADLV